VAIVTSEYALAGQELRGPFEESSPLITSSSTLEAPSTPIKEE
jgi:hypothetical protein